MAIPWVYFSCYGKNSWGWQTPARKVLSQPLLLRCGFSKPGKSIRWETSSFPRCKDTLILFLTIPLNSSFLGCPIGSPPALSQFRFPHHSAESLVSQPGNLYPRFLKGDFVLSERSQHHKPRLCGKAQVGSVPPFLSITFHRTNPEGICSFPYAAGEPGSKSHPHVCHCWKW